MDHTVTPKKLKPGPEADRLKLQGDWKDAIKRALQASPPSEGFPKPECRYKARKKKARKP
jgi:hypothetical protein